MIHGEIVSPCHRPKCNRGKIGWLAIATGPRDESNDLCAHENPSHTAIAIKPANASDIKYAVMKASDRVKRMCGMIAHQAIISGANPIPRRRPRADVDLATPRAGTFARAG
jgi:hypothetical protein